ncbi:hypothetical protein JTB14_028281 [Gonioctena quinquepunctata]|nr:hypothetical protein JTB14_028281 [Gonioctena quinquepunctata]
MPSSCATYNCVVRYKKGLDVKFHRFPKNELMRNNWVLAIRRKDYKPSATAGTQETLLILAAGNEYFRLSVVCGKRKISKPLKMHWLREAYVVDAFNTLV